MNEEELRQYLSNNPKYGFADLVDEERLVAIDVGCLYRVTLGIAQWLRNECIFSRMYAYYSRPLKWFGTTTLTNRKERKLSRFPKQMKYRFCSSLTTNSGFVLFDDDGKMVNNDVEYDRLVSIFDIGFNEWLIRYHYPLIQIYTTSNASYFVHDVKYFIVPKDKKWNIK